MDIQQVVREVTVRGSTSGMDQVARGYDQVSDAADRTATVTEKTSKAQASAEAAVEKLRLRYQDGYRQQQQYADAMATYQRAVDQGRISQQAAAAELANIQTKLGQATAGQKAASTVTNALNLQVAALAGNLGLTGQVLSAFGTAGFATAVGLGAVNAVLSSMSDQAHALADKAKELREFSEATGLTTTQFQALRAEAGKFGIDSDTLAAGLSRFAAGFQDLRNGQGDLLNSIRKINPALADQMQQTKDAATAFTLFGKAVAQTDDIFQRNALLKAGLGKGSSIYGAFFQSAPDVSALTTAFQAAGRGLDENLIQKLATLNTDIARTKAAANNVFAPLFAEPVLQSELAFANLLLDIAKTLKLIATTTSEWKFPEVPESVLTYLRYALAAGKIAANPIGALINGVGTGLRTGVRAAANYSDNRSPSMANYQSPANSYSTFQQSGTSASNGVKTPEALAADWKNYISVLGSAATPTERLNSAIAELTVKANDAGRSGVELSRAIAALKLDEATAQISTRVGALGAAATVTDLLAQKTLTLAKAQQQGANLTPAEIENQKRLVVEQANGVGAINGQIDALRVQQATMGMSAGAAAAYTAVETKRLEAIRAGAPLDEQQLAALREKAKVLGAATQAAAQDAAQAQANFALQTVGLSDTEKQIAQIQQRLHGNDWKAYTDDALSNTIRLTAHLQDLKDTGLDFAKSFVQGLLQGKSGMEALTAAADQLASKMADKALTDLFSGNFLQAGVEGIVAAGAAIFSGNSKQKKEIADAQAAWAKMTDQVANFNLAAKGVNLGPLTSQLQSLQSTYLQLREAAQKARDWNSSTQLDLTFISSAQRLVNEFENGVATLNPLAQAIKDVNDEAAGLAATLASAGTVDLSGLSVSTKARIQAVMAQYTDQLNQSLAERLNSAQSKDYLNQAADLLKQRQDDLDEAAILGNDPTMLAQIQATFSAGAQKIIEDAGLVGDSFNDFIKLFPQFGGVVTQSATALQAANDKFAALTKTISDYLDSLQVGNNSILSPQDQLAAAQSQFNTQLGLAQSGDSDALGGITKYASTLLDQAKSYYASSEGYSDIYRAVTSALASLTGGGSVSPTVSPSSSLVQPTLSSSGSSSLSQIVQGTTSTTAGGNDNGAYFANQTQTLVQAIGAAASAEIGAIKDGISELSQRLDRIARGVETGKAKPLRPNAKDAA